MDHTQGFVAMGMFVFTLSRHSSRLRDTITTERLS